MRYFKFSDFALLLATGRGTHSETYFDRGLTLMVAGNLSAACSDFQTYQKMLAWSGPNTLQASVWQYLCLCKLGRSADGRLFLQEAINKAPALAKAPEIAYLRGRLSAQNLIGVHPTKAELTSRCTLIGLDLVNAGKSQEALPYLQRVKTHGESRMDEYALALAELEKITRATPAKAPR